MSIAVMSHVWKTSSHKGSELLLLLAIADHANDKGRAWPGVELLALKTRLSTRSVMRLVQNCEQSGELEVVRKKGKVNHYKINLETPTRDKMSRDIAMSLVKGQSSDIAMSPEPSFKNNIQPSIKRANARKRDPLLDHPAIVSFREITHRHIPIVWRPKVAATVADPDKWRGIVSDWVGLGWNPTNVKGMLECYKNGGIQTKKPKPAGRVTLADDIFEEDK